MLPVTYTFFVLLIPRNIYCSLQYSITNPTISNSSGNYYVSHSNSDLNDVEIDCDPNKLCSISCSHPHSCNNIDIHCNDSNLCVVQCDGSNSCQGLYFYSGTNDNVINCNGEWSCYYNGDSHQDTIIYTNYLINPSSNTILKCGNDFTCWMIEIGDISGSYPHDTHDPTHFKILCIQNDTDYNSDVAGCGGDSILLWINKPLAIPNIINSTGEYYFNIGSFVDVQCSHNMSCFVDCSGGGCTKSNIHCGHSQKCIVTCQRFPGYTSCTDMNITAANNEQFEFICDAGTSSCSNSHFNVQNVDNVVVQCLGSNNCDSINFNASLVKNMQIHCLESCSSAQWNIDTVQNVSADCNGGWGCAFSQFYVHKTHYFDIICYEDCFFMDILPHHTKYGTINLDCCGPFGRCNHVLFCNSNDCQCNKHQTNPTPLPTITDIVPHFTPSPTINIVPSLTSSPTTSSSSNSSDINDDKMRLQCNGIEINQDGLITAIPSDVCITTDFNVSYMFKCDDYQIYSYQTSSDCSGDNRRLSVSDIFGANTTNIVCNKSPCQYEKFRIWYNETFDDKAECQSLSFNRNHVGFTEQVFINGYCSSADGSSVSSVFNEDTHSVELITYIDNNKCIDEGLKIAEELICGETNQCLQQIIDGKESGLFFPIHVLCTSPIDKTTETTSTGLVVTTITALVLVLICLLCIIAYCIYRKKRGLAVFGISNLLVNANKPQIEFNELNDDFTA